MGFINVAEKTINAKLVYYGVGMGGKTTSLQAVHSILCPRNEVQLVSINTEEDATLLFDFLPINLGQVEGFKIKIQGFTVPGQPKYRLMRKYVLSGADAVVFVVDSECSRVEENQASWDGLYDNLRQNGIDPDKIPIVIQYNKRDLDDILSEEALDEQFKLRDGITSFPSVATENQGVFEAFVHAAGTLVETKVQQYGLGKGSADPAEVAEGARRKLWELRDEVRAHDFETQKGPTTSFTLTEEPDEGGDFFRNVEQLDELPERDRTADLGAPEWEDEDDLVYELKEESSARPQESKAPASELLTDEELDLELGAAALIQGAVEAVSGEEIDETLLDKSVQSNLELVRRFGELDEYRSLLERKNQELVEIAQNTVHDLNKPLSAIKLMLQAMAQGYLGEIERPVSDAVENGIQAAKQLERLINDLLDSSRLDHDGVKLDFQEVDMTLLVADVIRTLGYEIDEKSAVVKVEPLPTILVDSWALTRVFLNILGNALQYCHPERRPSITVSCDREGDTWQVKVADNGIGIPADDRDRLFRRFERGTNTGGISGTGLGLHIIREIVMGHGGSVWVESTEGEGTTFYLSIPVKPILAPHSSVADVAERADL